MGSGTVKLCCRINKTENEPEILSKGKQPKKSVTYQFSPPYDNSFITISQTLDENQFFLNKIKKIGVIISNNEFENSIPINIRSYIKDKPFISDDYKLIYDNYNSSTEFENKIFQEPVKLKNNNILYQGEWTKDGIINGIGKMYKPDSESYIEGEWENGNLKFGRIINNIGIYIGQISDNCFNGEGKIEYANGDFFEGYFSKGEKHGQGVFKYFDGCVYTGMFQNNEMQGEGEFKWKDGNYYKGGFLKGILNGKGLFKHINGNIYNGDFMHGYFHGNGIFFWNGVEEYYKGEYSSGKKNGQGLYKFKNGDIYIGQWSENKPSGKGTLETKNKIYSGVWKDGKFMELIDVVSKYQSAEIHENIDLNIECLNENIDVSGMEHLNINLMVDHYANF